MTEQTVPAALPWTQRETISAWLRGEFVAWRARREARALVRFTRKIDPHLQRDLGLTDTSNWTRHAAVSRREWL